MNLKKGKIFYVRIDYKIAGKDMTHQDFQNHLNYVKNVAKERYFLGGGFSNIGGGMLLYEAENFEEAEKIANNDPIIENGFYRCEIFEWKLVVLSEDISEQ